MQSRRKFFAPRISCVFLQEIESAAFKKRVNPNFKAIFEFLDQCGPEVGGRAVEAPEPAAARKLQRFARGACDEAERAEVCTLLRAKPVWLRWVAAEVRQARPRPAVGTSQV